MDRFLNGENIERYRKLMKARSAAERRKILNLLAEESAKLKLEIQNVDIPSGMKAGCIRAVGKGAPMMAHCP